MGIERPITRERPAEVSPGRKARLAPRSAPRHPCGFPQDRIRICPLGVDVARSHPEAEPLDLMDRLGRPVREYRTRVLNARQDDAILTLKLGGLLPSGVVRLLRDLDAMECAIGKTRRESAPVLCVDRINSQTSGQG